MEPTKKQDLILLAFLPFWTPYIPPQGITTLKSYIKHHGYNVKIVDLNVDRELQVYYENYIKTLRTFIPYDKIGNFVNVGHDVLLNHMMAHVNYNDIEKYRELVKIIIFQTYYFEIKDDQISELINIFDELFLKFEKKIVVLIEREKPVVFGATAYSGTLASCLFAFKKAKQIDKNIKTIIGGGSFSDQLVSGSPNYEYFLDNTPFIDHIFIGQGQLLLKNFLEGNLPDKKVYEKRDIGDLNLPISEPWDVPDLSDLDLANYLYMGASGSRSCPFKCSFCNVNKFWGDHELKDQKQLVNELKLLYDEHHNQLFFMIDALLNNHIDQLSSEIIKENLPFYYVGYLRVSKKSCIKENAIHWRRGGFYRARVGAESGSQKILDLMDKKITVPQIKETFRSLAYAGIKTTIYIVIGHPEETEEDFQATLDLITELKDELWEAECNPFNYYYSGLQVNEDDWSSKRKLVYPDWATEMLYAQTWTLDIDPLRPEVYNRMTRFVHHCDSLGIPNPYSIQDIYQADLRWKKLHPNAVPLLAELRDSHFVIDDKMNVKEFNYASLQITEDEGEFDF